jgi:hypothetical protein
MQSELLSFHCSKNKVSRVVWVMLVLPVLPDCKELEVWQEEQERLVGLDHLVKEVLESLCSLS